MSGRSKIFYSLFLLFVIVFPCQSKERVIVNISQDYGGEALAISADKQIQLGAGLNTTIGMSSSNENSNIAYLISLGYKINAANFSGGAVLFTTYPINALVHYSRPQYNIGIGISHHLNPTYQQTCNVESECGMSRKVKFNSSVGVVFDYNYYMSAASFFGVRYTSMKYRGVEIVNFATNSISDRLDVSHLGIQLGYIF